MKDVQSDLCLVCFSELMVMLVPPAVPVLQGEPVALRCVVWGGPKLEKAVFYKNSIKIKSLTEEDTYTITNPTKSDDGNYSCHATYRFSHISAEAAQKEGDSDAQEIKVIGKHNNTLINTEPLMLHILTKKVPESIFWTWYHGVFYNIHAYLSYVITLKKIT